MSSIWDFCVFDSTTSALIQKLENTTNKNVPQNAPNVPKSVPSSSGAVSSIVIDDWSAPMVIGSDDSGIDGLQGKYETHYSLLGPSLLMRHITI